MASTSPPTIPNAPPTGILVLLLAADWSAVAVAADDTDGEPPIPIGTVARGVSSPVEVDRITEVEEAIVFF